MSHPEPIEETPANVALLLDQLKTLQRAQDTARHQIQEYRATISSLTEQVESFYGDQEHGGSAGATGETAELEQTVRNLTEQLATFYASREGFDPEARERAHAAEVRRLHAKIGELVMEFDQLKFAA